MVISDPKMENEKVHIRYVMFSKFRQVICAKAIAENICSVYGEGLITDRAFKKMIYEIPLWK